MRASPSSPIDARSTGRHRWRRPPRCPSRATSSERPPRGPSRVAKKPKGPWMRASSRHALSASHPRLAFASPVIRMARQRRVQRFILGAVGGDADEIVVGQSDERRFQRGREREIVVRQQRRAARRHEIEHGDVLADVEPVGAGHRHACLLRGRGSPPRRRRRACAPARARRRPSRRGPSRRPWWSSISPPARCGARRRRAAHAARARRWAAPRPPAPLPRRASRSATARRGPAHAGAQLSCTVPMALSSKDRPLKFRSSAKVASTAESTALA